MKRILAIMTAVAMLLVSVPSIDAAESHTREYTGSLGYFLAPFPGAPDPSPYSLRGLALMCPHTCWYEDDQIQEDLDGDGQNEIDQQSPVPLYDELGDFGGALITASTSYNSAVIKPNDDIYGTGAAVSACLYDPAGDNICDGNTDDGDNDFGSDWVCGSVSLVGAPYTNDYVVVWALTILVNEDLTACGAVSGSITADFFNV